MLDNGINIIDNEVKNIVILCTDETTTIQMIGRKRPKKGEKVKVFLYEPPVEKWAFRVQKLDELFGAVELLEKNPDSFINRYILNDHLLTETLRKILYFSEGKHRVHSLAIENFDFQRKYANAIICELKKEGRGAHIREILKAFGKEYNEDNWLDRTNDIDATDITEFLEAWVDKSIDENFTNGFVEKYFETFGKTNADRNDRDWGDRRVNSRLSAKGLDYVVDNNVLRRRERKSDV